MKRNFFKALALIAFLITTSNLKAQRVIGFIGDWHYYSAPTYVNNTLQYDYLTDVVMSFVVPHADGTYTTDAFFELQLGQMVNKAHGKGKKVHVSIGGYSATHKDGATISPDPIRGLTSDDNARKLFVDSMMSLVKRFDLDGLNFDWEFPASGDTYNLNKMLYDLKLGLINLESELNKTLELSIAVSANDYNSPAYNSTSISYVDFVYVMAFDNQADHHSTVSFAESALDFWLNSKGVPPSKLILGVPFYSRGTNVSYGAYRWFSNSDPAGFFNDEDGVKGNYNYNSRPILEEKIKAVSDRGCAGIFVWEIWEDRLDEYSLLRVLYYGIVGTEEIKKELEKVEIFPNPISDVLNINLNSSILQSKEIKYTITDITGKEIKAGGLTQANNSISTASITTKGLYFVTVKEGANQSTYKLIKK